MNEGDRACRGRGRSNQLKSLVVKFLLEHNVKLGRREQDSAIYPGRSHSAHGVPCTVRKLCPSVRNAAFRLEPTELLG